MPALETPAAPAAAPAATPTPSPSPAPSPSLSDNAAFKQSMDAEFGGEPEPAKTPAVEPKAPEVKKPEPKPEPKPVVVAPKPGDKPAEPAKGGPKELREELERVRTESKNHATKVGEYEAKIADYERRGKDADALKARLEQIEKAHNESQSELRALKREASPEFKKQYEQPMTDAVEFAQDAIKSFVRVDDQPADWKRDFAPLYGMAKENFGVAAAKARELFGDDQGPALMDHIKDILRTERNYSKAMEREKQGWEERALAEEGRKVQQRETDAKNWQLVNEDLKNTVEDYKDPVDDQELPQARKAGTDFFDEFIALTRSKDPNIAGQRMFVAAHVKQRLGAYEAQKLQIARHTARIAELEAALEETKNRQPGEVPRKPGGDAAPAVEEDHGAAMIKAMRAAS